MASRAANAPDCVRRARERRGGVAREPLRRAVGRARRVGAVRAGRLAAVAGRAAAAPGPAQSRRDRAHRGAPRPLPRVRVQRSLALERAAHALVPGVGRAGPVRGGAPVRRGRAGHDRAGVADLPAALSRAARSVGIAALRLAAGAQLLDRDGVLELRVCVRAVADPGDRRRSAARRRDVETRHRHRGAVGRDLVRAPVPARGGGRSRRRLTSSRGRRGARERARPARCCCQSFRRGCCAWSSRTITW